MAGEPRFFTRNYIDLESIIASEVGAEATHPRLFDRDRELQYVGIQTTDLPQVNIIVRFQSAGLDIARTIDAVAILNHNLKDYTVEYSTDGVSYTVAATIAGDTSTDRYITFGAVSAKYVRLATTAVQVSGQKRKIGELLVMEKLFEFGTDKGPAAIAFAPVPVGTFTRTADLGIIVNQFRWAGNRVERFKARLGFTLLDKADYDSLRSLVRRGQITLQLEPVERPEEFFRGTITPASAPSAYTSLFKDNGYNLELEFEED